MKLPTIDRSTKVNSKIIDSSRRSQKNNNPEHLKHSRPHLLKLNTNVQDSTMRKNGGKNLAESQCQNSMLTKDATEDILTIPQTFEKLFCGLMRTSVEDFGKCASIIHSVRVLDCISSSVLGGFSVIDGIMFYRIVLCRKSERESEYC